MRLFRTRKLQTTLAAPFKNTRKNNNLQDG